MILNQLNYKNATGNIPFNMTNDYMFRALLQSSKGTLKGIVCAVPLTTWAEDRTI